MATVTSVRKNYNSNNNNDNNINPRNNRNNDESNENSQNQIYNAVNNVDNNDTLEKLFYNRQMLWQDSNLFNRFAVQQKSLWRPLHRRLDRSQDLFS